ncbi:MAG: hypothetical protein GY847_12020 [Proteobacteria bacterium]|nr:hypothetical protein [Pseudomonadota bacterium]
MIQKALCILTTICFLVLCSCGQKKETHDEQPVMSNQRPIKLDQSSKTSKVANVVFVGQKQACKCTRDRIDKSWRVLQNTIKGRDSVAIERIQLDVDAKRYDELNDMKSLMVPPGLYFFNADKNLIDMLQGEVEDYQVLEMLR